MVDVVVVAGGGEGDASPLVFESVVGEVSEHAVEPVASEDDG